MAFKAISYQIKGIYWFRNGQFTPELSANCHHTARRLEVWYFCISMCRFWGLTTSVHWTSIPITQKFDNIKRKYPSNQFFIIFLRSRHVQMHEEILNLLDIAPYPYESK